MGLPSKSPDSITRKKKTKLGPKDVDCVFIGFANNNATYMFLVFKSDVSNIHVNTIIEFIDAEFIEGFLLYKEGQSGSLKKEDTR